MAMTDEELQALATYRSHNCSLLYGIKKPCECKYCELARQVIQAYDSGKLRKEKGECSTNT